MIKQQKNISHLFITITIVLGLFGYIKLVPSKIKDFEVKYFKVIHKKAKMHPIDIGISEKESMYLGAFGDLNGDRMIDMLMIDSERQSLITYYFHEQQSEFIKDSEIPVFKGTGYYIKDVFLLDMNQDGHLDAVVVGMKGNNRYQLKFVFNTNNRLDISQDSHKSQDVFKHIPQPFQIFDDEEGLLKNYLLIQSSEEKREVLSVTTSNEIISKQFEEFQNPECKGPMHFPLSTEYGGYFIDLNMDCRPDLLIESYSQLGRTHEIYMYTDKGFCFVGMKKIPSSFSMVSFMDLSQRGSNDAVFVTNGLEMHIFRNRHTLGKEDRKQDRFEENFLSKNFDLCVSKESLNDNESWPFQDYTSNSINDRHYRFQLDAGTKYSLKDGEFGVSNQILRFGDMDRDGHQDMMITAKNKSNKKSQTLVFKNSICSKDFYNKLGNFGDEFQREDCRYFEVDSFKSEMEELSEIDTFTSTFFDFGEYGNMGIIQVGKENTWKNGRPFIKAYFNHMSKGNYFLKAVGVSEHQGEAKGDRCFGCSFQTIRTEASGSRRPISITQMGAMTLNRLSLPIALIGLGKTTNYIENFYIGVAKKQIWSKLWTPLIPNSQVYLFPAGPKTEKWKIEVYVNPTQALSLIIGITVIIIACLLIVVGFLHAKEKREDKLEQGDFIPFNL